MEALKTEINIAPHEVFDEYFDLMQGTSESPLIYHRWTLISAVAALLGRDAFMHFGHEKIHPNMYVCLLGDAGTRKSSAISIGRKLLNTTGYCKFARERSSKEKFIKDLGEGFEVINSASHMKSKQGKKNRALDALEELIGEDCEEDLPSSEVYICAGELEDFLGQGDGAFISLLTNLWDNLPSYAHGKMTAEDIYIKEPTINLIGGATPTTFNTVFPPEVIGQGMMSRLILVYGAGVHEKITIPKRPDANKLKVFEDMMKAIERHGKGEYTYDDGAYEVLDAVYQGELELGDFRLESYLNRRLTHWIKLCIIIAAMNLTRTITREIAITANTILHYTERDMPAALGEFGKNMTGDTNTRFLQAVEKWHKNPDNTGKSLAPELLFKSLQTDYNDFQSFGKAMMKLRQGKKIHFTPEKGLHINSDATRLPVLQYVDFSQMPEYKIRKV